MHSVPSQNALFWAWWSAAVVLGARKNERPIKYLIPRALTSPSGISSDFSNFEKGSS